MTQGPQIRRHGFTRGFRWLLFAGDLFGRGARTLVPVAGLLLLVFMIQLVPLIGPLVAVLITPMLTAGLLVAFRAVSAGEQATPGVLFSGWRDERARPGLLLLGVWLMAGSALAILVLAMWLAPQVDLAGVEEAMQDPEALIELLAGANLFGGMVLMSLILAVVLGGLYFAVPLVYFSRWPVGVSLLWSLRALLRNWLAFLGFGAALLVLLVALFLIIGFVSMTLVLAIGQAANLLLQLLNLLMMLFIQVLAAGAQYVAFREVFVWPDGPADDDAPTGDPGRL